MNTKKTWSDVKKWLDQEQWEYDETDAMLTFVWGNDEVIISKTTSVCQFTTIELTMTCEELLDEFTAEIYTDMVART